MAEEGVGEIGGAYVHRAFLLNFNVFVGVGYISVGGFLVLEL